MATVKPFQATDNVKSIFQINCVSRIVSKINTAVETLHSCATGPIGSLWLSDILPGWSKWWRHTQGTSSSNCTFWLRLGQDVLAWWGHGGVHVQVGYPNSLWCSYWPHSRTISQVCPCNGLRLGSYIIQQWGVLHRKIVFLVICQAFVDGAILLGVISKGFKSWIAYPLSAAHNISKCNRVNKLQTSGNGLNPQTSTHPM